MHPAIFGDFFGCVFERFSVRGVQKQHKNMWVITPFGEKIPKKSTKL
jgi:hypothetical protein